ncbi:hypothetical protein [Geminicoccus flavidas]|uniref:hypothetical protein n=1 Tax=Geminicoccus flavidas TaxID=2506407 RepID=UPI0013580AA8|nr:hypothetical protein [Geminicoccus flavidas]
MVWPSVFARYRRIVLGSRMLGVLGRVQRQGVVINLVAERLEDLGRLRKSVGGREQPGAA